MLHAGKVIAATAVEVLQNPELIEKAKTELKERLQGKSYISPIPQDVKPLVKKMKTRLLSCRNRKLFAAKLDFFEFV